MGRIGYYRNRRNHIFLLSFWVVIFGRFLFSFFFFLVVSFRSVGNPEVAYKLRWGTGNKERKISSVKIYGGLRSVRGGLYSMRLPEEAHIINSM